MINFIAQHSTIIIVILITWVLGIFIGLKIGRGKKKNNNNSFLPTNEELDAFRYRREYIINLVIGDEKEIDYKEASDIILQVEDNLGKSKIKRGKKYKIVQEGKQEKKVEKKCKTFNKISKEEEEIFENNDFFDDVQFMFNPVAK